MATQATSRKAGATPTWTLGDRMGKALDVADIGVQEMADYLGVSRNTVSTWLHDRIRPSRQTLMLWSMRTGVDLAWIVGSDQAISEERDASHPVPELNFPVPRWATLAVAA